jgi:hypothetical protein
MRNGLAGSVDCEHETRIDLVEPAPTIHPVTQVGHDIVQSAKRLTRFFSLQVKNNHLFFNRVQL